MAHGNAPAIQKGMFHSSVTYHCAAQPHFPDAGMQPTSEHAAMVTPMETAATEGTAGKGKEHEMSTSDGSRHYFLVMQPLTQLCREYGQSKRV
jgi:hypothetical protein